MKPHEIAKLFKTAVPHYRAGNRQALADPMKALSAAMAALEEDEARLRTPFDQLVNELGFLAVEHRDLALLQRLIELEYATLNDTLLEAGSAGWIQGYKVLRPRFASLDEVPGLSIYAAFLVDDADSLVLHDRTESVLRDDVEEFMQQVRSNGKSLDLAIDFLMKRGLGDMVDYGLKLKDEWGNRASGP